MPQYVPINQNFKFLTIGVNNCVILCQHILIKSSAAVTNPGPLSRLLKTGRFFHLISTMKSGKEGHFLFTGKDVNNGRKKT